MVKVLLCVFVLGLAACAGKDGSQGATGPQGPAGADGLQISSITSCSKVQSGLNFYYSTTTFSNSDKFVKCIVSGSSLQVEEVALYKATMNGAVFETCMLVSDADSTPSSGYWTFSKTSGVRKAIYTDSGSAINGTTITYASSDCTTN
jgi:hypothetical protein